MEKYVIYGPENDRKFVLREDVSLAKFLFQSLKENRHKVAQINALTGQTITFGEIEKKSIELACVLHSMDIQVGDIVSICSENRLEYAVVIYAVLFLGAAFAPMNPTYTTGEIAHHLRISGPKVIFSSLTSVEKIIEAIQEVPGVSTIITFGKWTKSAPVLVYDYFNLMKNVRKTTLLIPEVTGNSPMVILSSSGTSGPPKGVILSQNNIKAYINTMRDDKFGVMHEKTILGIVPFFHGFGYGILLNISLIGSKLVILPKFEENLFLSTIEKYKVQVLPVVPSLVTFLAKHPLVDKYNLSSVTDVISGAAPCGEEIIKAAAKRLSIPGIHQGYGMTETSIVVSFCRAEWGKYSSVGKLLPGISCKIIDIKSGEILGPGKVGEICVKGNCIMYGYARDKKATLEAIDSDGWLHTGDIGYYDEEEFLYIVDRVKELIKYKGYQVAPAELEALILTYPGVQDVAVIGIPHHADGEHPMAFVVKFPNSRITAEDIIAYIAEKLSPQKWLRGGVKFVEIIPKNASGKILRRKLREQYGVKANL